jgi:hypothetical protein
MAEILLKKRGRKPKNKIIETKQSSSPMNSDEEAIIAHLPISLEDVVNETTHSSTHDNIFIKSEKDIVKLNFNNDILLKEINQKIIDTDKLFTLGKNVNKINVYNINYKIGTKCLWCKYSFEPPALELPEYYFNDIFYCTGNFCSWNCMKTHNIDLNDSSTWKRESLINLLYFKTYGTFVEIIIAPHWLMLEDFGGSLSISEFRKLFIFNNKDYLVLRPPLITRQLQIEESYKKSSLTKSDSIYDGELILKRTKPVESSHFNLEKTMGLKRKN